MESDEGVLGEVIACIYREVLFPHPYQIEIDKHLEQVGLYWKDEYKRQRQVWLDVDGVLDD